MDRKRSTLDWCWYWLAVGIERGCGNSLAGASLCEGDEDQLDVCMTDGHVPRKKTKVGKKKGSETNQKPGCLGRNGG
jgi:hypothetical protein